MELVDIGKMIAENGILVIVAGMFIWFTVQDRTKNQTLLEEIRELVKTLKVSNENIAHTLDLLQSGCEKLDDKADRNYEALIYKNKEETK